MAKEPIKVKDYLAQQIALSDKSQKEIAQEAGFNQPNNISMIKDGVTKLPINRIPGMAKALGIDPVHLLRMTMREYMPETWAIIERLLGQSIVSETDRAVLQLMHKTMRNVEPDMKDPTVVEALKAVFEEITGHSIKDRESAARAVERRRAAASK